MGESSFERRACQTVMREVLERLLMMIAPILPHLAEDAWQNLPADASMSSGEGEGARSIFQRGQVAPPGAWALGAGELEAMSRLLAVRGEVNKAIEKSRQDKEIGSSLEAKVVIRARGQLLDALTQYDQSTNGVDELRYVCLTTPPLPF